MKSILTSVKEILGIAEEQKEFDNTIVAYINTVFFTLHQMGVGPLKTLVINEETMWNEFGKVEEVETVKTYVGLKVKTIFDPSQSSIVANANEAIINEYEFRLMINAESKEV